MHISLQMQRTIELRVGFHILLLGFRQKLDWEMGFQSNLDWELGFDTPLHDPQFLENVSSLN